MDYKIVFAAYNGPGPWDCHFCTFPVDMLQPRWTVHHLDHNHENHDPENLVAMHDACHKSHHHTGRTITEETRKRMSDSAKSRRYSPEARAKFSAAWSTPERREMRAEMNRGRKHSGETRRKMSEAHKRRLQDPEARAQLLRNLGRSV